MADFGALNHLAPEVKIQIVQAQAQADEARERVKANSWAVDLTGKMQIRDNCQDIERIIRKISRLGMKEESAPQLSPRMQKEMEALRLAMIRLQTVVDGLLG